MHTVLTLGALLCLVAATTCAAYPQQPANPVVGVMTSPLFDCPPIPSWVPHATAGPYTSCVSSYIVRLLENQGARVVPFAWNMTYERQLELAMSLNGVYIPGGGISTWDPRYEEFAAAVRRLYRIARTLNAAGDRFLLWGTCWGYEMLVLGASNNDPSVISHNFTGTDPAMLPLVFTPAQPTSQLFGSASQELLDVLTTQNSTLNWHRQGVLPETIASNEALSAAFTVTATSVAPGTDRPFVAALEDRNGGAIFGVQFHADRPPYEFTRDAIGHTPGDIAVGQYVGRFIMEQLRRNNHSFASPMDAEARRIAQWPLVDFGWGLRVYYIVDKTE